MKKLKALRRAATQNGAVIYKNIISRRWRKRYQKMREQFLFGIFCAGVMGFLIGGAALDSDPVAGMLLLIISGAVCGTLYLQNAGGRLFK